MTNKEIAKNLRAAKTHVIPHSRKSYYSQSLYLSPYSCFCVDHIDSSGKTTQYYEGVFCFGDDTFDCTIIYDEERGEFAEYLTPKQAYTARIMALELAALLAEEGQKF